MFRVARKFTVSGTVQGVGFRFFAQRVAARYQVTGYVRNLADGRVESYVEGTARAVDGFRGDFVTGPANARVTDFEEEVFEPEGRYSSFRVER